MNEHVLVHTMRSMEAAIRAAGCDPYEQFLVGCLHTGLDDYTTRKNTRGSIKMINAERLVDYVQGTTHQT